MVRGPGVPETHSLGTRARRSRSWCPRAVAGFAGPPASVHPLELGDPAAHLPQSGLGLWTPRSAGVGGSAPGGAEDESPPPQVDPRARSSPDRELGAPPPSPRSPPPTLLVGAPRPWGRTPQAGQAKPPNRGQGVVPALTLRTQPSCRAGLGSESTPARAPGGRLPSPASAPQQASRSRPELGTHSGASGPFQPWVSLRETRPPQPWAAPWRQPGQALCLSEPQSPLRIGG